MINLKKKIIISCSSLVVVGGVLVPIILVANSKSEEAHQINLSNYKQILKQCEDNIIGPTDETIASWQTTASQLESGVVDDPGFLAMGTLGIPANMPAQLEFTTDNQNIYWEVLYGAAWRIEQGLNKSIDIIGFNKNTPVNQYTNIEQLELDERITFIFKKGIICCYGGTEPGVYLLSTNEWIPTKQNGSKHSVLNGINNEYFDILHDDYKKENNQLFSISLSVSWHMYKFQLSGEQSKTYFCNDITYNTWIQTGFTSYSNRIYDAFTKNDVYDGYIVYGKNDNKMMFPFRPTDKEGNYGYHAPFLYWKQYDEIMRAAFDNLPPPPDILQ